MAADLKAAADLGVQVAVVVGGGNFFRGLAGRGQGHRARARRLHRHAGDGHERAGDGGRAGADRPAGARAVGRRDALAMPALFPPGGARASRQAPRHHVAGGTGNPFFTTDTGAALRAAELSCDAVMKATQVDGIYTADPKKDPSATRFERLTHDDAIACNLQMMDTAAFALGRDNAFRSSSSRSTNPARSRGAARPGPRDLRDAMRGGLEARADFSQAVFALVSGGAIFGRGSHPFRGLRRHFRAICLRQRTASNVLSARSPGGGPGKFALAYIFDQFP